MIGPLSKQAPLASSFMAAGQLRLLASGGGGRVLYAMACAMRMIAGIMLTRPRRLGARGPAIRGRRASRNRITGPGACPRLRVGLPVFKLHFHHVRAFYLSG